MTFFRALWALLVRRRERLPREELEAWGWSWWFLLTLGLPFAWLGLEIWGEAHGWLYHNTPHLAYWVGPRGKPHPYTWYDWFDGSALMMGFAAAIAAFLLLGIGGIWRDGREARATNRLRRRSWPETQKLRRDDRIRALERELGMGSYDSIGAIEALTGVPCETPEPEVVDPMDLPVRDLVPAGVDLSRARDAEERELLITQGCTCHVCETLARHVAWHEHLQQIKRLEEKLT
jgi:hypothetical protein